MPSDKKITILSSLQSAKLKNRNVIQMHKGQPHIRTEVVFLTPINVEDKFKFSTLLMHGKLDDTLKDMVHKVQEDIGEAFESDIESVYVSVRHTL